jgi:hypothetical protein
VGRQRARWQAAPREAGRYLSRIISTNRGESLRRDFTDKRWQAWLAMNLPELSVSYPTIGP